jgi:hypothetical protein
MRNKQFVLLAGVMVLAMLACNLPTRTPTIVPAEGLSLTVTALTRSLEQTASPSTSSSRGDATQSVAMDTPAPLPTAPELVRLVTGASATYFATPPTIDGQLGEWMPPAFLINAPVYGIENWRGADDLSGTAMFGWDEDYFYFAVHVTDDVYVQNATDTHIYKGDSIEILFDADLEGDFFDNALSDDDVQLGLSPGNPTPGEKWSAYQWLPVSSEGVRPEIAMAASRTSIGYDVEAVIPWSMLGASPKPWAHFGFAFTLSDNDKVDTVVQQSMVSNTPDRRLTRPMTWGDLVLTK